MGYFLMGAFAVLLTSCGFTEMPDNMKKTLDIMEKTRQLIVDTKTATQLETAFKTLADPNAEIPMRKSAAETVFKLGQEDRVGGYLGMMLPMDYDSNITQRFRIPMEDGSFVMKTIEFANVAIVQEKADSADIPKYRATPMSRDLFNIVSFVAQDLPRKVYMKSLKAGLSQEEIDELNLLTLRMSYLAPAILGAITVKHLKNLKEGRNEPAYALHPDIVDWQKDAVDALYGASRNLKLGAEFQAMQTRFIRNKLVGFK